ncbi:MAG: sigma-54 dependent transcriptional regulator [Candidatus Thiodiazotropha lotti]|uniref:Fis family transcriptional regulator n=1 Tax=Candidatus Thiodiazotropha endoloripes TaxID=1818881 RepID=A0A1E2UKU3_9GAMM|nr:sigma-54 dependent transcriptional regulator [Candidatus Thiodiazotropha endoloripes]MCG7903335.1 sigma-54 dependent transcriptional regulator [Candidatus Thiodiazotropha weberae]MCG7928731.1 sigma-54 dependent transcriptional regulator [Candidatus Thiodiazotropha lotti]MCG7915297.1 sigma-54 dependent transcriptional regulator [Candidatus Thiodiazotropha weberae]MCG7992189.1 sigma-54 dependent transcriptional regulator [Candidatus Thiodiazotropha lotti]MCG7998694.1 sigma-54 dependent transc
MTRILLVDDDIASCRTLQLHLSGLGHEVSMAHSVDEGLQLLESFKPGLVVLDIRMPGKSGLQGLPEFKSALPEVRIIMITAFHDMESTIEAMQKGADDYIHKPIDIDEFDDAVEKLLSHGEGELVETDSQSLSSLTMVGNSRAMKEIFKTIGLVAKSPATVLITGESGTGKELVARAIHRSGENPDGPFVVVNCAAIVETLLESDMFGHEKGAFTGAVAKQAGKFKLAENGTIFLDEVGELSPVMQAKLLRVIQHKEFTPLGAKESKITNARIIAATNVNLAQQVSHGAFREDLFYRLQVVNIHLPPLRERKEDIMGLVQALLARINGELNRKVVRITSDALRCLQDYHWPGNVRELENALMKAVALCPTDTLSCDLLPMEITGVSLEEVESQPVVSRPVSLQAMEKAHVKQVLEMVDWHKGRACEILEISRPRLRRMIQQYELQPPPGFVADKDNGD